MALLEHAPIIGRSARRRLRRRAELERVAIEAEQRYRTMTGMDEPLADRAMRARSNAAQTPLLKTKTW